MQHLFFRSSSSRKARKEAGEPEKRKRKSKEKNKKKKKNKKMGVAPSQDVSSSLGYDDGKETENLTEFDDDDDPLQDDGGDVADLKEYTGVRAELMDIGKVTLSSVPADAAKKARAADVYAVKNKYFRVKENDVMDPVTGQVLSSVSQVVAIDYNLSNMLFAHGCYCCGNEKIKSFLMTSSYPIFYGPGLVQKLQQFRAGGYAGPWLDAFMEWLQGEYNKAVEKIEGLLRVGKVGFDGVWYLFEIGNRFYTNIGIGLTVASEVKTATYLQMFCGAAFHISGDFITSDGNQFFTKTENFQIHQFSGLVDLDQLTIKPMTQTMLDSLTERGRAYQRIALGHHYLNYERFMHYKLPFGVTYIKADGRVMVDTATFNRLHEGYKEFDNCSAAVQAADYSDYDECDYSSYGDSYGGCGTTITAQPDPVGPTRMHLSEDVLYKTWPTVAGFSFAAKAWGEIIITNLSPIQFDDDAYDQLVLDEEKKKLIKALVEDNEASQNNPNASFSDIISGKGGGVIFLLHGPPGSGKTLTAEAISELLHRPLYSVSVGELGTTAEELEQHLGTVLEVAGIWNAVILIDEADIFLERRREHDIVRNAMVGIFLRKLEYHQGVLFLTSNRVQVLDPAFNSRVSIALKYHELTDTTRKIVWHNLLEKARAKDIEELVEQLFHYPLNGRQIRTAIRLGFAIARNQKAELNDKMMSSTIETSSHFFKEITEMDGDD